MRITGPSELAFPDYDGNGMFKSLGNLVVNPNIGLLFISMNDKPKRLRVYGSARVSDTDPLLGKTDWRPTHRAGRGPCHLSELPTLFGHRRWSHHRSTRRSQNARRRSRPGRASMPLRMPCIRASRPGKVSSIARPLLAQSRHDGLRRTCPLSAVKQTRPFAGVRFRGRYWGQSGHDVG